MAATKLGQLCLNQESLQPSETEEALGTYAHTMPVVKGPVQSLGVRDADGLYSQSLIPPERVL